MCGPKLIQSLVFVDTSDCNPLTPPDNGAVNHLEGTVYLKTAYFTCNAGYTRSGLASVTCQSNATWNGAVPVCNIKGT